MTGGDNQNPARDVNMANIRRKVEKICRTGYLFAEVGVGYRMANTDN